MHKNTKKYIIKKELISINILPPLNVQIYLPPSAVIQCSPSLCQGIVTEMKNKLVEGVWLDLSHLLFLLFHNFHRGFLQRLSGANSQF